jgi:uncharacterized protein (DUF488 family)
VDVADSPSHTALSPRPALWSIGYESHTPDSFVAALRDAGVTLLVDVRELASSRRKGFSKTPLSQALGKAGIRYVHLRALGAPKPLRAAYKAGGGDKAFREGYARHLDSQWSAQHELEALARAEPTATMCREEDPLECHRIVLTERLAREGWRIEDIRARPPVA